MCDQKSVESITILPLDNVINVNLEYFRSDIIIASIFFLQEEILKYVKNDVCPKLDSLSSLVCWTTH